MLKALLNNVALYQSSNTVNYNMQNILFLGQELNLDTFCNNPAERRLP